LDSYRNTRYLINHLHELYSMQSNELFNLINMYKHDVYSFIGFNEKIFSYNVMNNLYVDNNDNM